MKWVHEFYTAQYKIFNELINDIRAYHESPVEKVESIAKKPALKIIELGGGQGKFAVAAAKQGHDVTVVELIPSAVEQIHALAREHALQIIQGDFMKLTCPMILILFATGMVLESVQMMMI